MNPPRVDSNVRPMDMYAAVEATYKPMPDRPDKTFTMIAVIVAALLYLFVAHPLIQSEFNQNEVLHGIAFVVAGGYIWVTLVNYRLTSEAYTKELTFRTAVKQRYSDLQQWFDGDRHVHRTGTGYRMVGYEKSNYPLDWKMRREYVRLRDGGCFACKDTRNLSGEGKMRHEAHHIQPISQGGAHDVENLVYLCLVCHEDQHEHMLKTRLASLKKSPKRHSKYYPKWQWIEDIEKRLVSLESHRQNAHSRLLHKYQG